MHIIYSAVLFHEDHCTAALTNVKQVINGEYTDLLHQILPFKEV